MKVLLVNYEFPPFGGGGGRVSYEVAKILSQQTEVDVLTAFDQTDKIQPEKIDGVNMITVPSLRKSVLKCGLMGMFSFVFFAIPAMRKALKEKKYDLVHYFFSIPTGLISLFQPKNTPYIVSLNGGDVPYYTTQESRALQALIKPINRAIVKRASAVSAVSADLALFAKKQFGRDDIRVIYNGIDANKPSIGLHDDKQKNEVVKIICVTRLSRFKRVDLLIRALQGVTGVALEIFGDGPCRRELEDLVAELGLQKVVAFRGYVKNDDLGAHLKAADIFVLPSNADSFGIVFLEAMACGLPAIGCRAGGVPEVVVDGQTGLLVQPNSLDGLKQAIEVLKNDQGLRARLGEAGLKRAKEVFDWQVISGQYLSLYQSVLLENQVKHS